MRLKILTLWPILMLLSIGHAYAQETGTDGAANKLRARASLYEPLIASAGQRYNVDPSLLWTIAYLESRFRQEAISYKDGKPCAYGMMQFTPPTAARYGLKNPHDVRQAIDAAARYVRDLQKRFGARGDLILAAYNAGEGTVEAFRDGKRLVLPNNKIINPRAIRTGGIPPYGETREYVARGKIVYEKVRRERRFSGQVYPTVAVSNNEAGTKISLEDAPTEGSLYSSEFGEKQPTEQLVKSAKTKRRAQEGNSIYVN